MLFYEKEGDFVKKRLIVVLFLFAALLLVGCGKDEDGGSSKKSNSSSTSEKVNESAVSEARTALKKVLDAGKKGDAKTACKYMVPFSLLEEHLTDEDCIKSFEEPQDFSYEIVDEEEYTDEKLEEFYSYFDNEDSLLKAKDISGVVEFKVKWTEDGETDTVDIGVIKYKGEWLVVPS